MVGNSTGKRRPRTGKLAMLFPARGASRGDEFARGDAAAHHFLHSGASKLNFNQSITMSAEGGGLMISIPLSVEHPDYALLAPIALALVRHAGDQAAFSAQNARPSFRQAIDEVIDAPRTNRFTLDETKITEKTYLGTKIEILLRNHLKLGKGNILDLSVDGYEVDIKNTMGINSTIPLESYGHPALFDTRQ